MSDQAGSAHHYSLAAFYERLRSQIEHENGIYDQRMIWLVTLQAILFATMGFIIGGFLNEDLWGMTSGLPQNAIIMPILLFVGMVCIAGAYIARACERLLSQSVSAVAEVEQLWLSGAEHAWSIEQGLPGAAAHGFDEIIRLFPDVRGGVGAFKAKRPQARSLEGDWVRSRYIPRVFFVIWLVTLLMVLLGIVLVFLQIDPLAVT